jgi:pilus assembly protein CpaE
MTELFTAPAAFDRSPAPSAMAFVSDAETEELVRRALGDLSVDDAAVARGTVETATATLGRRKSPRLLIVDISGVENPLLRIGELADKCEPEVNVVTIGDRNDILLYQELKTAGVSEYFFKPLVRDSLKRVCNRILNGVSDERPSNASAGKLVFVLGVRGGVGATTIAVNAAMRLADKGQRWVMLVDLDLEGGDAALQLAASPTNALHEALERPERVDKLFLERGALHVGDRLDLLASLEPFGRGVTIKDDAVLALIDKLLLRYRFVFVDLPTAAGASLVQALHRPSACVLVSSASLASARDLARWREWIGPNTPERRTLHVLNMNGADGALPQAEFVHAVGHAPDVVIPYDRGIAAGSSLGAKAAQKSPALNRGLAGLLRDLAGETAEKPRSMLQRLFG